MGMPTRCPRCGTATNTAGQCTRVGCMEPQPTWRIPQKYLDQTEELAALRAENERYKTWPRCPKGHEIGLLAECPHCKLEARIAELEESVSSRGAVVRRYREQARGLLVRIAELEAEKEKLQESREYWRTTRQEAQFHRDGANRYVAELEASNAALRKAAQFYLAHSDSGTYRDRTGLRPGTTPAGEALRAALAANPKPQGSGE